MKTLLPNLPALAIAFGISVSAVWAGDGAAETAPPANGNTAVAPVAYFNFIADEAAAAEGAEPAAPGMLPPVTKFTPERTNGCQSPDGACRTGRRCGRNPCSCEVRRGLGIFWDPWCSVEFVHAWTKDRDLPPLVTTGGVDGVLGTGETVLFPQGDIGGQRQNGGRIDFGAWFDQERIFGFGANFFAIEGEKTAFSRESDGSLLLARPFFDTSAFNAQRSLIVTKAGVRSGSITVAAENELMSAEAYLRLLLHSERNRRLDLIGGYHFSRIDDSLRISHNMLQLAGAFPNPPGTTFRFEDNFDVKNEYQAGEVGLWGQYDFRGVTLSMMGKLSMGNMHREVEISGHSNKTIAPGNPGNFDGPGGLLALGSNLGTWTGDKFVIAPEADIKLLFHVTPRFDVSVGYSLLCWDAVALAGQQIDTSVAKTPTVNSTQLLGGGPAFPDNPALPSIKDTRFWVQSLTLGGVFKF